MPPSCRPASGRSYRCGGGKNLASDEQFEEQRERAERVLDWYRQYVQLLRRLQSGVTPTVVDVFCGGGGSVYLNLKKKSSYRVPGSNQRPSHYKCDALPLS
jgi:hypothetical protein